MEKQPENIFKISPRVSLPVNEEKVEFVPEMFPFEDNKYLLEQIGVCVNNKMPILLVGETGSGKTSLVRSLAAATGNGFRRVNHNGATTVDDIVGKILVNDKGTFFVDGVLVDAMRKGYWYLADEINAAPAEINFSYNSLLDDDSYIVLSEHNGEVVRPHPNFRFFAAMNPTTDYAGTKEMNKALLSRFMVFKVDFPSPSTEAKILVSRAGIDLTVAQKLVKFAAMVRENHAKQKSSFVLSTRDLIMWAKMYRVWKKYMVSAEMSVLNKVPQDDFESIKDALALSFNKLDEPKQKAVTGNPTFEVGTKVRFKGLPEDSGELEVFYSQTSGIPASKLQHGSVKYKKNEGVVADVFGEYLIVEYKDDFDHQVRLEFKESQLEKI